MNNTSNTDPTITSVTGSSIIPNYVTYDTTYTPRLPNDLTSGTFQWTTTTLKTESGRRFVEISDKTNEILTERINNHG